MIFRPVEVWLAKLPHATWGALTVPSTYLSLDLLLRLYWPCRHAQPITQSFLSISPEGRWRIRVKTTDSKFDIIARSILHLQQLAKIFKVYKMSTEALLVLTWKLYVFIEGIQKELKLPLVICSPFALSHWCRFWSSRNKENVWQIKRGLLHLLFTNLT